MEASVASQAAGVPQTQDEVDSYVAFICGAVPAVRPNKSLVSGCIWLFVRLQLSRAILPLYHFLFISANLILYIYIVFRFLQYWIVLMWASCYGIIPTLIFGFAGYENRLGAALQEAVARACGDARCCGLTLAQIITGRNLGGGGGQSEDPGEGEGEGGRWALRRRGASSSSDIS